MGCINKLALFRIDYAKAVKLGACAKTNRQNGDIIDGMEHYCPIGACIVV
jgi:hypothetical protein